MLYAAVSYGAVRIDCLVFHLVLYIIPVVLYNFITVASITC